jgi:biotin synthase
LHADEHQDRRLQRGLRLLFAKLPLRDRAERESLAPLERILETAERARANGSTRFCMGAAWRGVTEHDAKFKSVLETVREVSKLGMEVCVTLGQLTPEAARQLRAAGVTAYNHNLDTSPEFYPNIVTTHTFEDRLNTIRSVQRRGCRSAAAGSSAWARRSSTG